MKRAIVWFKTDLRLQDNETLQKASEWADEIIPMFCYNEKWDEQTHFGTKKFGEHRKQFLFQSLIELEQQLEARKSGLIFCKGNPVNEILRIAKQFNAQRVYAKKEVAFEEVNELKNLNEQLLKSGIILELYSTSTLYHATDLPFSIRDIPEMFTNFRKQVEKDSFVRDEINIPENLKSPLLEKVNWSNYFTPFKTDERNSFHFIGGEIQANKRLTEFIQSGHINHYKQTRDQLHGSNYSSKFSPWLAFGCISPRTIYHHIKNFENQFGANDSTYWLIFELIWRDFFRFSFKKHPREFFLKQGIAKKKIEITHNEILFESWKNAETDQPLINAFMNELKQSGFISNRGRQIVASYFIYELKCDWRYGAAFFEEHLIDYDPSSNWGNWAYIAGVGNDSRGGRIFNIEKQAEQFDKDFSFRNKWLNKVTVII
jgi:deoxyribodipyrimidine photo-lyase